MSNTQSLFCEDFKIPDCSDEDLPYTVIHPQDNKEWWDDIRLQTVLPRAIAQSAATSLTVAIKTDYNREQILVEIAKQNLDGSIFIAENQIAIIGVTGDGAYSVEINYQ